MGGPNVTSGGAGRAPVHVRVLARAHRQAAEAGVSLTDDAAALERLGIGVAVVAGDPGNVKITTALDLAVADSRIGEPHA